MVPWRGSAAEESVQGRSVASSTQFVEWRTNKAAGVVEDDTSKKRKYPGADADSKREAGPAASQVVPLPAVHKKATKKTSQKAADSEADAAKNTPAYPSMHIQNECCT